MKKLLGIVVLYFLFISSSNAIINELNTKLLNLEKKIDNCLKAKDSNTCDQLEIVTTFLIDIIGNQDYAKLLDSSKCDLGSKCGATISRISGKYLKIMGSNFNDLISLDGLNKIINKETEISNNSIDQTEKKKESNINSSLTFGEEDALKAQIFDCWSIPLGLPYNENLLVRIKLKLKPDGTILKAEILDHERLNMPGQGYYKVLAESALRAVRLCEPLKVPSDGYERWRELILNFDAREMLQG